MFYMAIQGKYGIKKLRATFDSKMAIFLISFGVIGMGIALTIAGYEQVLIERAQLGGTWDAFFIAQNQTWMAQAMDWRLIMGVVTTVGFFYLVKDLLTISKNPNNVR